MKEISKSKIGILAIQGDFAAHAAMLQSLGAETAEVRTVADLEQCDGLVLPGGESTTQLQFLQEEGLFEAIKKVAANNPALVQKGNILAATFHPELTDDPTVHQHFLDLVRKNVVTAESVSAQTSK